MTDDAMKERVHQNPEFVASKRYHYSIKELEDRYPDGCPNNVIATVLMLDDEGDVEVLYTQIVLKLRTKMGIQL